jgi:hypothetical protein
MERQRRKAVLRACARVSARDRRGCEHGRKWGLQPASAFLTKCAEEPEKHGLAETLDFLGVASLMSGDLLASASYYKQAIALWRDLDDRQGLIASLSFFAGRGGIYQNL